MASGRTFSELEQRTGKAICVIGESEDDDFKVMDTRKFADTLTSTTRILTMLLGAVAAVSLLIGGIGIMSIMLVSVIERTGASRSRS